MAIYRNNINGQFTPKYKAHRVEDPVYGWFDSKWEHERFHELLVLEAAKEISGLRRQVPFKCEVNGKLVCTYKADAVYQEGQHLVVEDAKGFPTADWRIKWKLMQALYPRYKFRALKKGGKAI